MDAQTRVLERKIRLDGTVNEFECDGLLVRPGDRAVLRYVLTKTWPLDAAGLAIPPGTRTIAHYWADRTYNVYHWVTGDGRTLALYCNVVGRTRIEQGLVEYEDLAVDVVIVPSGAATVLDEDELPEDLPSPQRAIVNKALEELTGNSRRLAVEIERETRPFL